MTTILLACLGCLMAIGLIVWWVKKNKKENEAHKVFEQIIPAPKPIGPNVEKIFEGLVQTNICIRINGAPSSILNLVEQIVDDLCYAAPLMAEKYPGETLTYELGRIGEEHLKKQIKEFFEMSSESRLQHEAELIKCLEDIKALVRRARYIIERNEITEFQSIASFLNTKYSDI